MNDETPQYHGGHVLNLLMAVDDLLTNMTDAEDDEDPDTGERRADVIAVELSRDAVLRSATYDASDRLALKAIAGGMSGEMAAAVARVQLEGEDNDFESINAAISRIIAEAEGDSP